MLVITYVSPVLKILSSRIPWLLYLNPFGKNTYISILEITWDFTLNDMMAVY